MLEACHGKGGIIEIVPGLHIPNFSLEKFVWIYLGHLGGEDFIYFFFLFPHLWHLVRRQLQFLWTKVGDNVKNS